jgi:hypothetical protein
MSLLFKTGLHVAVILHTFSLAANDGVYRSNGGVFHPVKETTVQLHREFLSFTCRDKQAQVDVRFEFLNPDPMSRTLTVGFQAPTASDVDPRGLITDQIRDFRVMQEGRLLPYRLMAATCEDCPLQDTSALRFDFDQGGVFVYLFELTFQPGINVVQHSYTFPASSGVWDEQNYAYILRTGGKWAGGRIGELEVEIDMGPGTNFIVNDIFGPTAESSIIGTGHVYATDLYGERDMGVRILSGKLRIHVQDLDPQENLYFGIESSLCFTGYHGAKDIMPEHWVQALCERSLDLGSLTSGIEWTKQELRLLRNAVYAHSGLAFRDEELKAFFQRFPWYVPDPNLRLKDIRLSPGDERFIAEVLTAEKNATR